MCVIIFYTISFYCLAIKRSEWKEQYVALACRSIKMGGRQKHLAVQHLQRTTINPHCYMSLDEGMLKLWGYTTTVIEQSSTALVQFQACELNRSHPKAARARACVCVCACVRVCVCVRARQMTFNEGFIPQSHCGSFRQERPGSQRDAKFTSPIASKMDTLIRWTPWRTAPTFFKTWADNFERPNFITASVKNPAHSAVRAVATKNYLPSKAKPFNSGFA